LSQVGFIFESDDGKTKTIYFEGVGPDNYQGELPAIIDPNLWNTNNITPLSSLEDTVTTISYEWDINGDGNAEYSGADKRKISHTYTFATGEGKKVVDVYFRVKLQKGDETFYAKPDQVHFIIYKDSSIWSLSCEEWSSKWSYIGLDVIALPFCWLLKGAWFVGTIPFRVGANIAGTFEYICASSYGMTAGVLFPLLLVLFFLLLLIVPDDIISFGIASVLVYVLGTTAPAVGTLSMLASAGGTLATIGSNASLIAIGGGISLGPKAIFWILFLLAVKETFYSQGALTVPFVSYRKKGDDIIPTEKSMTVRYGSGISQLRHIIAEALFVVLGAMWVECHWGIPVYTAVLGAIDAIIQGIQIVGGAI
jgi:hypothetical protein